MNNNTFTAKTKATTKQIALLRQLGHTADASGLTLRQASELIERLKIALDEAKARILASGRSVRDMADQLVLLHKETSRESSGPCPKCGGADRFHCTDEWFMCRQCHEKRGDLIEFVQWKNSITFIDAIRMLDGNLIGSLSVNDKLAPVYKPIPKPNDWDEAKQLTKVIGAHKALMASNSENAKQCSEYLLGRGIAEDTQRVFKLGYRTATLPSTWDDNKKVLSYPKQAAITLPWFDRDGTLPAVKYRFIESHDYTDIGGKLRNENKTSRGNFFGRLFGWQAVKGPDRNQVLIITEGEMNALSLWQAGEGMVDVLSTGTESMMKTLPDDVIEYAQQYPYRIVWADKGEIADETARRIGAASMRSPGGQDANDLLKAGKLEKLLSAMLKKLGAIVEAPIVATAIGLTDYVGQDVDASTWADLQAECTRRYGDAWQLHAEMVSTGYHVTGLTAGVRATA